MAQARLSVRKIREVLRLKSEARLSDRQIAAVLGSARSTVQECLRRARTAGLSWPLPELDDDELHERLYPRTRAAPRYPTPDFERKASRVLDLYEGRWQGAALSARDCVVCADEKTSIQARRRCHATLPAAAARPMRVEHEYDRLGAWAYLAAWDVRRARVHGRCERATGIAAFDRLVAQVMRERPYRCAPRVFWIMDNASSHRGARCVARLQRRWPNLIIPVHTPVHASWLNQVEIYFSVLQRKALTPNDFRSLRELQQRLLGFQEHYAQVARPFQWRFTRRDLRRLMLKLNTARSPLAQAA